MKYTHIFFDLDHTLWDFDTNSKMAMLEVFSDLQLKEKGVHNFDLFFNNYLQHNEKLWEKYRKGMIKQDELRWKRMSLSLLDFKIGDLELAKRMAVTFLDLLPTKKTLFPHCFEILDYLADKHYKLHLITNGFEITQRSKLQHSGLEKYFKHMITSEASNSLKPHKEIFDYAFRLCNAAPDNSIMIGDTHEVDILGAKNAGMDQVFVNHINGDEQPEATYSIFSLKELEEIL